MYQTHRLPATDAIRVFRTEKRRAERRRAGDPRMAEAIRLYNAGLVPSEATTGKRGRRPAPRRKCANADCTRTATVNPVCRACRNRTYQSKRTQAQRAAVASVPAEWADQFRQYLSGVERGARDRLTGRNTHNPMPGFTATAAKGRQAWHAGYRAGKEGTCRAS